MTTLFWLMAASQFLGALFLVFLVGGLAYRLPRLRSPWAVRRQIHNAAAGRFIRGEIDADAYRRLRDDLKDLF